jgi:hypothetical protein
VPTLLRQGHFPYLFELDVRYGDISDDGLLALARSPCSSHVERMWLGCNPLSRQNTWNELRELLGPRLRVRNYSSPTETPCAIVGLLDPLKNVGLTLGAVVSRLVSSVGVILVARNSGPVGPTCSQSRIMPLAPRPQTIAECDTSPELSR